jgi:DNA-binding transcriptional LysR family regulator
MMKKPAISPASRPPDPVEVLTPQALAVLAQIEASGSLAGAARALHVVPSALTYRVRVLEDALDVLLLDRSARKAQLTAAGRELLREGSRVLTQLGAVAHRVKRIATGWEPQFTLACDNLASRTVLFELCEAFEQHVQPPPPTQLRLRTEVLAGVWEALLTGRADLAIGLAPDPARMGASGRELDSEPLGTVRFVFAVAPCHPLADSPDPLGDELIGQHRAVAIADTASSERAALTVGLLPGQSVLTVPDMQAKLQAQLRGLGCGFLPEPIARPWIDKGQLRVKHTQRKARAVTLSYIWRRQARPQRGLALQWWLDALANPKTREALLMRHAPFF